MSVRKQPWLGITATALVIVLALLFIAPMSWATFGGWVSFAMMCAIPFAIVVGAYWHGEHPASIARLKQPVRGLAYLALTAAVAAVVALVLWTTVGGSVGPPLPMLAQATILSVVVSFWLTIMWGGWPFSLIRNELASGVALLVGGYVVAAVLFEVFFDYGWLEGAPVYIAALDPAGLFNAWDATVFAVTALAVMFLVLHLDLWPLTRSSTVMRQPVLGLVWTALVVVIGLVAYLLGTRTFGMTPPDFLVTVPIPFIFGSVVLLNMLQDSLFAGRSQPVKGVLSAVSAMVVGTVLALLFRAVMPLVTGSLPSGPATFDAELWLANALLAVTFPFLAFYGDYFQLWPLAGPPAPEAVADDGTDSGSDSQGHLAGASQ
ncbi:MAG TPA: hypothetical protein VFL10_12425 [Ornithinibacter sp.]|nr:hypothetical protein [Ornithinibacter sp.]